MEPVKLFISYAHEDETFKNELLLYLNPLKRSGKIKIWSDGAILVGDKWDDKIKTAMDDCEIMLFLISPWFLASDYINDVEIKKAIERHKQGKLRFIPIMVSQCDLESHIIPNEEDKISDFQGLPRNMKPIDSWSPRGEGWMDVISGLKPAFDFTAQSRASQ